MMGLEMSGRLSATAQGRLGGHIVVPGDKSISHRALILGALAVGETIIEGLLESRDALDTATAVRAFGAKAERRKDGNWRVGGVSWRSPATAVDCGNSGTGARLLMGAAAGFPIEACFTGDVSLRGRPMARVIEPLRQMGARFESAGTLPIRLRGGGLRGLVYVNDRASAQVKSAVLIAGLRAEGPVEIVERIPSRDHTENLLKVFGCDIEISTEGSERRVRLGESRRLTGAFVQVPGDPSSAAFPLVAALIAPGSKVSVHGVLVNPLRSGLFETLVEMGADLVIANRRLIGGELVADITASASPLRGVVVPAARAPAMIDEYPILSIAAACAHGETVMHGLGELRLKESDRLEAILDGLGRCGVEASAEGDSLRIQGLGRAPAGGVEISSHGDHRIAMAFLVLGLAAKAPVTIDAAAMIATSFPGFVSLMRSLGGAIAPTV